MSMQQQLQEYRTCVEQALEEYVIQSADDRLKEAMRYSLLSPGKRLRGSLCLAACEMAGGTREEALPFAAAIEMIHAYSLIHDDLPAMDNDTLRRGLPTNHVVYGESMAILAGDGLLTEAFRAMSGSGNPNALKALAEVAACSGARGMVGGQAMDTSLEGTAPDKETVLRIHQGKTAALIRASVLSGMICAGADEEQLKKGAEYADHLGIAFQIVDDLLDITGDEAQLGKHAGKDAQEGKLTWVAAVGEKQARIDAGMHTDRAVQALESFGNRAEFLQGLAIYILSRVK
ncbi:MAG: hypothetical protein CW338_03480 [Clostridiales bacterium]|nr:hypothetical protein [Clostridiales bacterium]